MKAMRLSVSPADIPSSDRIFLTPSVPILPSLSMALRTSSGATGEESVEMKVPVRPLWETWTLKDGTPIFFRHEWISSRISKSDWALSAPIMSKSHCMNSR